MKDDFFVRMRHPPVSPCFGPFRAYDLIGGCWWLVLAAFPMGKERTGCLTSPRRRIDHSLNSWRDRTFSTVNSTSSSRAWPESFAMSSHGDRIRLSAKPAADEADVLFQSGWSR